MPSSCTAPIDIADDKVTGDCSLKCTYQINYGMSSPTIVNMGDCLALKEFGPTCTAKYNDQDMIVTEARFYFPSLHKFQGGRKSGELLIIHEGYGKKLIVSVPIVAVGTASPSGLGNTQVSSIFSQGAKNTPNKEETSLLKVNNFSLNNVIPMKVPFYSYTGTKPDVQCGGDDTTYIVFADESSAINIPLVAVEKIKRVLVSSNATIYPTPPSGLYLNKKGVKTNMTDDIYIDCNPVDAEGNILVDESEKNGGSSAGFGSGMSFEKIEPYLFIILGLAIAIGIERAMRYVLNKARD
jgi:carbonic anhydrase